MILCGSWLRNYDVRVYGAVVLDKIGICSLWLRGEVALSGVGGIGISELDCRTCKVRIGGHSKVEFLCFNFSRLPNFPHSNVQSSL